MTLKLFETPAEYNAAPPSLPPPRPLSEQLPEQLPPGERLAARDFFLRWRGTFFTERQAAQSFFIDLCRMVGHPAPGEMGDPDVFTFEKRVPGGACDVWFQDRFAWEFKTADSQLDEGLNQLLRYQVYLGTPPLLVVSSFNTIRVRTNFRGMETVVYQFTTQELMLPENLQILERAFFAPDDLRPVRTVEEVTQETAGLFHTMVADMEAHQGDPEKLARYLNQLIFCLYAEDAGLLRWQLFTQAVDHQYDNPAGFDRAVRELFQHMADGEQWAFFNVAYFNGDLFHSIETVELSAPALERLSEACRQNWTNIEPSIFGTLFERALDASKRAQLGAHFTSEQDIMLVVEPVVLAPLRREWDAAQGEINALLERDEAGAARARLAAFQQRLAGVTVLDPACGSGNFLYLALRSLLDLEKEAIDFGYMQGWGDLRPGVLPSQLFGLETNPYAAGLARISLWIGHIQWHLAHGFGYDYRPILPTLNTIYQTDAILDLSDPESPQEPEWPAAEFIIGNPPFLGRRLWNQNLERAYIQSVDSVYRNKLPRTSDLCCYWFEKARAQIAAGITKRAGLLATQNIRAVYSRGVLERIVDSGGIFAAYPDHDWLLEGANVHVSIVGFDDGSETDKRVNDESVSRINANLTSGPDVVEAQRLAANAGLAFRGANTTPFDIPGELARQMLALRGNPNGRPNSEVIAPLRNGQDLAERPRGYFTINFGAMDFAAASLYQAPFEHARNAVASSGRQLTGNYWQYRTRAVNLTAAVAALPRYIAHSVTAKHLTFVWVDAGTVCNNATNVFARDDDYFFGILHSRIHEIWARALGTQLRDAESAFRYTPTTCFETFPFPEPTAEQREAVAAAANQLNRYRENVLNPQAVAGEAAPTAEELRRRTLTNLYNNPPTWLLNAHAALDAAVAAAYGWPADLGDEAVLQRLLALNLARAAAESAAAAPEPAAAPADADADGGDGDEVEQAGA